jgi:hypothetical protein
MPVVRFGDNLTLVTQQGNTASIKTDPYPLGAFNQADVRVNVEVLDQAAGGAQVDVKCEASNDGQTFLAYNPLDVLAIVAPGVSTSQGGAPFAFIRFVIELTTAGGAAGDMAWTTLDMHVNFTQT